MTAADETAWLQNQAAAMEDELAAVRKRLTELEKEVESKDT